MLSMIEIGKPKTVTLRKRVAGRFVVVTDDNGPVTKTVSSEVRRVTKKPLDGSFCRHRGRKLVVRLASGDLLSLKPKGTRKVMTAQLSDVYRWMIQCAADKIRMEKLRNRKVAKQARLERMRIKAAENRLFSHE